LSERVAEKDPETDTPRATVKAFTARHLEG
jgi:hypothetical protein